MLPWCGAGGAPALPLLVYDAACFRRQLGQNQLGSASTACSVVPQHLCSKEQPGEVGQHAGAARRQKRHARACLPRSSACGAGGAVEQLQRYMQGAYSGCSHSEQPSHWHLQKQQREMSRAAQ